MHTEWRPVVGYENRYAVSSDGQVMSLDVPPPADARTGQRGKRARIMRQTPAGKGYLTVVLSIGTGRNQRRFYVHRLMAAAFLGPSDQDVRHLDDNHTNNVISNLAYGTQSLNEYDKIRNGNHHQLKKTHCPYGHEYSADNTYRPPRGGRVCRKCKARTQDEYLQRKNAAR